VVLLFVDYVGCVDFDVVCIEIEYDFGVVVLVSVMWVNNEVGMV